ncbi:MAG: hypothetical protein ABI158_12865 [Edaphobacter sp.]
MKVSRRVRLQLTSLLARRSPDQLSSQPGFSRTAKRQVALPPHQKLVRMEFQPPRHLEL